MSYTRLRYVMFVQCVLYSFLLSVPASIWTLLIVEKWDAFSVNIRYDTGGDGSFRPFSIMSCDWRLTLAQKRLLEYPWGWRGNRILSWFLLDSYLTLSACLKSCLRGGLYVWWCGHHPIKHPAFFYDDMMTSKDFSPFICWMTSKGNCLPPNQVASYRTVFVHAPEPSIIHHVVPC